MNCNPDCCNLQGANFNDGFGGGLVFEGNLLFNVVQDTGEHGATNSWDRQPMIWLANGRFAFTELPTYCGSIWKAFQC
jgi:hypothetical protein